MVDGENTRKVSSESQVLHWSILQLHRPQWNQSNFLIFKFKHFDSINLIWISWKFKLNGINTQGENIADNGGVREAFKAYRYYVEAHGGSDSSKFQNLTPEQVFFLAYANSFCGVNTPEGLNNMVETDPHRPHRFRVIGTLSKNEDFVREFKCGAGTPMNSLNKCTLW